MAAEKLVKSYYNFLFIQRKYCEQSLGYYMKKKDWSRLNYSVMTRLRLLWQCAEKRNFVELKLFSVNVLKYFDAFQYPAALLFPWNHQKTILYSLKFFRFSGGIEWFSDDFRGKEALKNTEKCWNKWEQWQETH